MLQVIYYQRPNGKQSTINMTEIDEADEKYLKENTIEVSMEEVPPAKVAVYGKMSNDPSKEDFENTAMVLHNMSIGCRLVMHKLVEEIQRMKAEQA